MPGYGFAGHIGLGKESAWGTAVAATDYIEAMSESLSESRDRYDVKNIVGRYAEPDDMAGLRRIGGDVTFAAHPEVAPLAFLGTMGIHSQTIVLSDFLYTHEFTMATAEDGANNPLPPFTFEMFRDVTSSQRYEGVQFSRLQLACAPNQDLRLTASLIGKSSTSAISKTSPSYVTSPTDPFAFDTCSLSFGGAAIALVEAFNLTLDNQLEGVPALNASTTIARVRRTGPQLVRLSGSIAFENITDHQRFINQTEIAVSAYFTRADSHSLLVELPRFVYSAFPLGAAGRERLVVAFEGLCRYHTGSAAAVKITTTNNTSGY